MKKIFPILAVLGSAAALIAYKMKKEEEKQIIDLDQGLLYDDAVSYTHLDVYKRQMLFIFRFGTAITVPGVDTTSLTKSSNSLLDMINLLGGGGLEQMSIFAMGVGPYILSLIHI